MSRVFIAGVGMTPFGKMPGRGIRALAVAAIDEAMADAGIKAEQVSKVFFGNAVAGIVTHQEMIRGQVALRHHPLAQRPVINVENACASGGSALNLAYEAVAGGRCEVAIAVGAEQLNHVDKARPFNALRGSTDIEDIGEAAPGPVPSNSILMEFYAAEAKAYLLAHRAEPADFARVAVKNRQHAALNPLAHFRTPQSVEDVLAGRMIVPPLTLPMCSPTTDGAAALVVCSESFAKRLNGGAVEMVASEIASAAGDVATPVMRATRQAYETAALGPADLDLIELHDAAAPAELMQYVEIGLCAEGEAHHLLRKGVTRMGGATPVNVSGGLLSRGHPLAATGCAQVVELCTQLRGRAGPRQVADARVGMAVNGGGWLNGNYAVAVATVVRRLR